MVYQTQTPYHKTSLRPLTTAHLAHTMTLLGLNAEELHQKVESELSKNPALELVEDRRCPTCHTKLSPRAACPKCTFSTSTDSDAPIVFVSPPDDFSSSSPADYSSSQESFTDNEYSAVHEDLPSYVLSQISTELAEDDRPIAAHILTSLDDDGLLSIPVAEIAQYHHVSLSRIASVLNLIQHADPIGVGSPSVKHALLVQLDALGSKTALSSLAAQAIESGLELLSRRQYSELAKILGVSISRVKQVSDFISENLNPFPARSHWGNVRHHTELSPSVYNKPDVIIRAPHNSPDSRLQVEILWPLRGFLRINPLFQKALAEAPEEKTDQWKASLEQANLLIKCLSQRNHTIVRLMERLAVIQREYILNGNAQIRPLTRASLAEELGVHESTVSRAVSSKSVQLPSGKIVPISQFFDRSLHIRTALLKIVGEETSPLSDTKLAELLAAKGHKIARRTVAKYRAMEGILPAHLRPSHAN